MRIKYLFCILLSPLFYVSFAQNNVKYIWSGALTPHSMKVNAKLKLPSDSTRLVVSETSNFLAPVFSSFQSVDSSTNLMKSYTLNGLKDGRKYYYAIEINGVIDTASDHTGSFTTPLEGPQSFTFAFNSCVGNGRHGAFDKMKDFNPLFWINHGDLHYGNPNSTDIEVHRYKYEQLVFRRENMARFLRHTPLAYVWDDHDFCGNDSDSSFIGKENARQAYREYVPHYPLAFAGSNGPIYQSFTIGRLHFILTDLRSTKSDASIMDPAQMRWFLKELLYARDQHLVAVWACSMPWNSLVSTENWANYTDERRGISNFLRDSSIKNMFMLLGDSHMLAIDDGTNGSFCSGSANVNKYPMFHAAAIAKGGSDKGGTFNQGGKFPSPSAFEGQYGIVHVNDNGGDTICITFEGYRTDFFNITTTLINSYSFCRTFSGVTSIEEPSPVIFPNPSEGSFNVSFSSMMNQLEITLYDLSGKCVFNKLFEEPSYQFDIGIKNASPGYYIMHMRSETLSARKKIILY